MKSEYFLSPKKQNFYLLGAFVLVFFREIILIFDWFIAPYRGWTAVAMYIVGLSVLILAIEIILIAYTQKIIVTANEITFQTIGMTVTIKWNDVQRIGIYRQESIFAPKNKTVIKGWQSFGVYGKEAYIPLEDFSKNWRDSELGQQIKQYAPHLFQ